MDVQTIEKTPVTDRGSNPVDVGSTSTGIDWVTATVKPGDRRQWDMLDIAKRYWASNDTESKAWNNRWYDGLTGAGLSWGVGKQGAVFIASGQAAPYVWSKALATKARVTRLDLQVTVDLWAGTPTPNLPKVVYENLSVYHKGKRQYGLIQNTKGGVTLYAGSRQSDQYGRFYDKGVESKTREPGYLYRYEVELKHPRSGSMASHLLECLDDGVFPEKTLAYYVYEWWYDRGVRPIFKPHVTTLLRPMAIRTTSDNDRRLTWLHTQVSKSVGRLIDDGHGEEVIEALGLREYIEKRSPNM